MICIYTGDDFSYCTCSACRVRRDGPVLERGIKAGPTPMRPFLGPHRRRPCPTGIPGSLDGVVPYQPSRCASSCTCCAVCRGEETPFDVQWWHYCTCPSSPTSNCVRDHSALVECRGGCKPRPVAMAVVVKSPGWIERALRWIVRSLAL